MTKNEMLDRIYEMFTEKHGTCDDRCYLYHYHGADCIHTAFDPSNEIDFYWEDCRAHVDLFNRVFNPGLLNSHVKAFERSLGIPF